MRAPVPPQRWASMQTQSTSGSRLGLGCSGPRVYQIFGSLGACWYVSDRFLLYTPSPAPLLAYHPTIQVGQITTEYILCTLVPNHWTPLTSQGCTAVSIDTCTALARFIGLFWSIHKRSAYPGASENPYTMWPRDNQCNYWNHCPCNHCVHGHNNSKRSVVHISRTGWHYD